MARKETFINYPLCAVISNSHNSPRFDSMLHTHTIFKLLLLKDFFANDLIS